MAKGKAASLRRIRNRGDAAPFGAWRPDRPDYRTSDGARWSVRIDAWHPAKLNDWDGRHWSVRARAKRHDRDLVAACVLGAGVPKAQGKRRVSVEIVLGPRQRGGDPDAYWKSLLDALVACGALDDDSKERVVLGEVSYSRGPVKATVIQLEDVT